MIEAFTQYQDQFYIGPKGLLAPPSVRLCKHADAPKRHPPL